MLDRVFDLPDIPWPVVVEKDLHRIRANLFLWRPPAQTLQKIGDQQRQVREPLAKRRHCDRDHVKTVIEVFPKGSPFDFFSQVPGRCRKYANVDPGDGLAPQPVEFSELERPEELDLGGHGDIAYFVQEQGASLGEFEQALTGVNGAGECALFMAEHLGLQQRLRIGGAIEHNEGTGAS